MMLPMYVATLPVFYRSGHVLSVSAYCSLYPLVLIVYDMFIFAVVLQATEAVLNARRHHLCVVMLLLSVCVTFFPVYERPRVHRAVGLAMSLANMCYIARGIAFAHRSSLHSLVTQSSFLGAAILAALFLNQSVFTMVMCLPDMFDSTHVYAIELVAHTSWAAVRHWGQ